MESLTTTGAAQPPPAPVRSATVESPLAPHEALKDGNKCPSASVFFFLTQGLRVTEEGPVVFVEHL